MKLLSFTTQGQATYGALKNGKIVDLGRVLKPKYATLQHLLAEGLADARKTVDTANPELAIEDVVVLPPISGSTKIVCIGLNYAAHAAESGNPVPPKPPVFSRWPDSLVGHDQAMIKPHESEKYDWEAELCVVIGKRARRVPASQALSHVAGYTIVNEGSLRDWQHHSGQFIPGKNFYHSGSIGPWIVTTDEISDPSGLGISSKLNGTTMQNSNTSDLIFNVPTLIEYVSTFTQLEPGDMISTGTPEGVGAARKPPIFMKAGDTIEVSVEKIGTLRNTIKQE
jgi:2-keto-4-pentenoate hydratase/2-oxohepta-3-ene-1,7-dioic acid hydratase in catechol pathway